MPDFNYTARDQLGKMINGTITAANRREAASALAGQAVFPLSVNDAGTSVEFARVRRVPVRHGSSMAFTARWPICCTAAGCRWSFSALRQRRRAPPSILAGPPRARRHALDGLRPDGRFAAQRGAAIAGHQRR